MKKTFVCLASLLLSLAIALPLSARTWTQAATGNTLDAEFVGIQGGKVRLKMKTGRTVDIEIATLSVEDQAFLKQQASGGAKMTSTGGWPQFRGGDQSDISPDTGLLKEWPAGGPPKLWTYERAGMGYGSFSFADGKLFTLGSRGDEVTIIALDANTGEELWARKIATDDGKGYNAGWGGGPRSTPTYSDGKLYALGPKGSLTCVNASDGKEVWSKSLVDDFGGQAGGWGFSESPSVDGNKVIVAPGGNRSPIVALNKETGETIWAGKVPNAGGAEYASVVIATINDKRQYIKLFQKVVVGVDAESGELLWSAEWSRGRTAVIPTPIVAGNEVYVTSGYGAGSMLVKIEGGSSTVVWDNTEMKNHHGGVVKVGDYLYGFSDGAGLICQSWKTGEIEWNQRGQGINKGAVHVADGMLYCLNEQEGTVTLAEVNPKEFVQKGQFNLSPQSPNRNPQGRIWSHPVVIGGKLYLRDQEYITCYDVKAK